MKLLFLTKRRPQQRDLLDRPYGRFHYLPAGLAALGHEVRVLLLGHHGQPSGEREFAGVLWRHHDIRTLGPAKLDHAIGADVNDFSPDWLIGCSDAWFGWLAHRWARRSGARLAIDAYDNYESYMPWNLPLHWAWRRALRQADLVTAAGPQLAQLLDQQRKGKAPTVVVPMTADPSFQLQRRDGCRASLALPESSPLLGYSGAWTHHRGTHVLLEAFRRVRATRPDTRLVLTGNPPAEALNEPGVIGLGYLPDQDIPTFLNSLNVACVITADTPFGRYSYPAKLCEAMACGVPVVATSTAPVSWMLDEQTKYLARVGDPESIATRVIANLDMDRADYGATPTWRDSALILEKLLISSSETTRAVDAPTSRDH